MSAEREKCYRVIIVILRENKIMFIKYSDCMISFMNENYIFSLKQNGSIYTYH